MSKAMVRGVYQRGLEEIADSGAIDLTLITPPGWREGTNYTRLERRHTRNYSIVETPIVLNGHYHTYFFPRTRSHSGGPSSRRRSRRRRTVQSVHLSRTVECSTPGRTSPFLLLAVLLVGYPCRSPPSSEPISTLPMRPFAQVKMPWTFSERKDFAALSPSYLRLGPGPVPTSCSHSGTEFIVGYVGRLVTEKGVDLLIRACGALGPGWRLHIVGNGDQAAALRRLASDLGLSRMVDFYPAVPSSDVPGLLRNFDVLVLPSRSLSNWREQFGRILIEAMACEVPVSDRPAARIPQVIADTGLIFPEGSAAELRNRLQQLQNYPGLRGQLGRLGRRRVLSHFTYRKIAHQTAEIYQSLAWSSTYFQDFLLLCIDWQKTQCYNRPDRRQRDDRPLSISIVSRSGSAGPTTFDSIDHWIDYRAIRAANTGTRGPSFRHGRLHQPKTPRATLIRLSCVGTVG